MKIIQIMPEFGLAGAEIMCENLVYELVNQGLDVIVISLYDFHSAITDRLESHGIDIRYLNKKSGLDLTIIIKLLRIFRIEKPDVIHTHRYVMEYAIPAAILGMVRCRVHTVHNIANKENIKLARILNSIFFRFANVIPVALSSEIQNTIVSEYHLKRENVPIIFNGMDLTKCCLKTDYSIYTRLKILHIGRFCEQKNHIGLLKAFNIFHKEYKNSVLQLIGIGEKRVEAEEYVKKYNLCDSVEFLDLQPNVYNYLHDADIFTLPSLFEGIPMTIIEAMGTGIPIVATTVGGMTDILENDFNAILTDVDSQKIADAFMDLATNLWKRENLGTAAREISRKFSSATMAEKYIQLYDRNYK